MRKYRIVSYWVKRHKVESYLRKASGRRRRVRVKAYWVKRHHVRYRLKIKSRAAPKFGKAQQKRYDTLKERFPWLTERRLEFISMSESKFSESMQRLPSLELAYELVEMQKRKAHISREELNQILRKKIEKFDRAGDYSTWHEKDFETPSKRKSLPIARARAMRKQEVRVGLARHD